MPISKMKATMGHRELDAYRQYYNRYGMPEEGAYLRSAYEIMVASGNKCELEDIYPLLGNEQDHEDRQRGFNKKAVRWDRMNDTAKKELIGLGFYTEDGKPIGDQNPNPK